MEMLLNLVLFCPAVLGNSLSAILDGKARLLFLSRGEEYVITMPYAHCKGKTSTVNVHQMTSTTHSCSVFVVATLLFESLWRKKNKQQLVLIAIFCLFAVSCRGRGKDSIKMYLLMLSLPASGWTAPAFLTKLTHFQATQNIWFYEDVSSEHINRKQRALASTGGEKKKI